MLYWDMYHHLSLKVFIFVIVSTLFSTSSFVTDNIVIEFYLFRIFDGNIYMFS